MDTALKMMLLFHNIMVIFGIYWHPGKLTWQWKTNHLRRCISYQKWWFSSLSYYFLVDIISGLHCFFIFSMKNISISKWCSCFHGWYLCYNFWAAFFPFFSPFFIEKTQSLRRMMSDMSAFSQTLRGLSLSLVQWPLLELIQVVWW